MHAIVLTAFWGILMMFGGIFFKKKSTPKYWAIAGMAIILLANIYEFFYGSMVPIDTRDMLKFTSFSLLFNTVAFTGTLLFFMLNGKDFEKIGSHVSEYFSLLFFALCGVSIASSYNTLLLLFLGIELMSLPLYVLTGIQKQNLKGNEAALKYFLMGAFSTAILLMGIVLIYGGNSLGSFYINFINIGQGDLSPWIGAGMVLLLVAMAFKVSAAPFHFWAPDVYDGAPSVISSFMATIVKIGGFIAFIRLFENAFGQIQDVWQPLVMVLIAATLLIGNVTAVFQRSVKRMLAHSSVAQAGFMMFAIFALNDTASEGLLLYAAAYSLATIGMFGVVARLQDYTLEGFNGLGKTHPGVALCCTVFLLSLTGIPLTAGFTAKFFVLLAAVRDGHHLWLVIFAVLCVAVGAVYYFRVIQAIYFKEPNPKVNAQVDLNKSFTWILAILAALIILLGIVPNLLIDWIYY